MSEFSVKSIHGAASGCLIGYLIYNRHLGLAFITFITFILLYTAVNL